jgi:cation-transporting ATPase 13A3/4/5
LFNAGWLMFSMGLLSAFNVLVLLVPPKALTELLTLMPLPVAARQTLLMAAVVNVGISMGFEAWGTESVSKVVGDAMGWWQRGRRRVGEGKDYKTVEWGMVAR